MLEIVFVILAFGLVAKLAHNSLYPPAPEPKSDCPPHAWSTHDQGFLYCKNCKKLPGIEHNVEDDIY